MDNVTVFVLSNGERGRAVRELAEAWTRAGILTPSLWVTPSGVTEFDGGPPLVEALYVHVEGSETVDLFEHVGRFLLSLVRVVTVHLVTGEDEDHMEVKRAGSAVATSLDSALPRRADAGEGHSRLHRAVVVVPASGAANATAAVFETSWEVNAVISPEDRPDLDRSNVFVRYPGNFDGHAAAAISAVGGILRGVGTGALDKMTTDSTSREADAVVARLSMRSIIGEDLVDRIAARALDPSELAPDGPAQVLHWARPATRPDLVAESAASHLLARPEWSDVSPPSTVTPKRGHQGLWHAIWAATKYNVRTVGAVTSWFLTRGRARVEARATEAIVGSRSGVLVTLGPRPVDDLTNASARLLERERSRIDGEMRLQATRAHAPAPSTWTELRRLAFGLVDGGDLGDFPEPRQAGKRELLPTKYVVAEPGQVWTRLDGPRVFANDPRGMRSYTRWLDEQLGEARAARDSVRTELERLRKEADRAGRGAKGRRSRRRPEPGEGETTASGAPGEEQASSTAAQSPKSATAVASDPKDRAELEAKLAELEAELAEMETALEALSQEREGYGLWYQPVSLALLWRVTDDVGRRGSEMRRVQEDIRKAKDQSPPPAAALRKAHKALVGTWSSTVPVMLVVVAALAYLAHGPLSGVFDPLRLTTGAMWWGIGITVSVCLLTLAAANHHFYKAVRRYEWAVEERLARLQRDKTMFVHAGQQRMRFDLLYDALQDWSDIVSELLHRPWAKRERHFEELPDDVIDALPAAMGVASQVQKDEDIPSKVMLAAWWVVYPEGWASRQFEIAHGHWEGEDVVQPDEGHRAVDLDALDSPTSPRRRLREFFEGGGARVLLAERAYADLMVAVRDGDVVLPERMVERLGRYGDGRSITEHEFHRASATDSTLFATDLFTAVSRQSRKHYVERSVAWVPMTGRTGMAASESVEIGTCDGPTALRVDVSRRVAAGELVTFAEDPSALEVAVEKALQPGLTSTPEREAESTGFF